MTHHWFYNHSTLLPCVDIVWSETNAINVCNGATNLNRNAIDVCNGATNLNRNAINVCNGATNLNRNAINVCNVLLYNSNAVFLIFCLQWWRQKSDESAWRLSTRFFMFETYPSQATCVRIFEYGFYFKRYISIESSNNHQCESCDSGFHGQVDFLQPRGPDSRDTAPSIAASSSLTFPGLKKSRVLKKTERVINETTKCMHAYH